MHETARRKAPQPRPKLRTLSAQKRRKMHLIANCNQHIMSGLKAKIREKHLPPPPSPLKLPLSPTFKSYIVLDVLLLDTNSRSRLTSIYTGKEDDPAYEFRQLFVPQYRST